MYGVNWSWFGGFYCLVEERGDERMRTWRTTRERLGVVRGFWISLIVQERFKIFLAFHSCISPPIRPNFLLQYINLSIKLSFVFFLKKK